MKCLLPFIAIIALFAASCSNTQDPNPSFKNRGLITGQDFRRCVSPCCGGWFIEIEGVTYRFLSLPPNSDVQLTETNFPIPVRVSWAKGGADQDCARDVITIYAIEKE